MTELRNLENQANILTKEADKGEQRQIQGVVRGAHAPPSRPPPSFFFFAITCFFCNNFEELQTVLLEVELIINNKP